MRGGNLLLRGTVPSCFGPSYPMLHTLRKQGLNSFHSPEKAIGTKIYSGKSNIFGTLVLAIHG